MTTYKKNIKTHIVDETNKFIEVKIKKINTKAVLPTKSHPTDIGYDVVATEVEYDGKTDTYIYHTGLSWEAPNNVVCLGFSRSSNCKTECYQTNFVGVIDPNYRGEIQWRFKHRTSLDERATELGVFNYINLPFWKKVTKNQRKTNFEKCKQNALTELKSRIFDYAPYKVGDKIGQFVFMCVPNIKINETNELTNTDRGNGGFGSTGR